MACPYFYPVERFDDQAWVKPPRLPLGDAFRGVCRAIPDQSFEPDAQCQRQFCNRGYARAGCARFPHDDGTDAIRFSIESDDGARLEIVYVFETNWSPESYGRTECSYDGRVEDEQLDPLLRRQMEAFLLSYLSRRRNSSGITESGATLSSRPASPHTGEAPQSPPSPER